MHFGYATAKLPWGPWLAMRQVEGVDVNPTGDEGDQRGLYPSLLDPRSPGLSYETTVGGTAYLYWVQGRNKTVVTAGYAMSCDLQHGDEPYGATENNCKGSN